MYRFRIGLLLIFWLPAFTSGQQVLLHIKGFEGLIFSAKSAFDDEPWDQYGYHLGAEYVPKKGKVSLSVDMAYAYWTSGAPEFYYTNSADNYGDFYRECYAIGAVGRYYLIDEKFKLFADGGLFYNRTNFNEVIKVRANYNGLYEEYRSGSQNVMSINLGVGISLPMFWGIRFEPVIRTTFATNPRNKGVDYPLLAASPYYFREFPVFIYPLNFKIPLWQEGKQE